MSRLGKKIIALPQGVTATFTNGIFSVKGSKGELSRSFDTTFIDITVTPEGVSVKPIKESEETPSLWGTYASHVLNMIEGVTVGFTKKLILEGVGFKADVTGNKLTLALGFSHPVFVNIPATLQVKAEKGEITISGLNKEEVGQFSASLRVLKKPEPYKGKGFRYSDEIIRRKQGKKTV